jgi:hypothetical protein
VAPPSCSASSPVRSGRSARPGGRTPARTWSAARRSTATRSEQKTYLRVHPIPPIDGIYAQWDHNAGAVETYYNPHVPDGVAIDGRNDEVFGNTYLHVSAEGILVDGDDSLSDLIRDLNDGTPLVIGDPEPGRCSNCVSNDVDTADPLFSGPNALLAWEQIAGPHGTLVTRWSSEDVTPGGAAHAPFALPYYRDDACFDDGTGATPARTSTPAAPTTASSRSGPDADGEQHERECWDIDRHRTDPEYAADLDTARFTQGSIGTHGMHLLLIADSDNAATTLPLTEINAEQRIVVLPRRSRTSASATVAASRSRSWLPLAGDIVTSLVAEAAQTMTPASLKRELVRTHPPRDWVTSVGAIEDMSTGAPPEGAADTAPSPSAQPAPTTSSGTTTATADIRDIAPSDSTSVARHVAIVLASFGGSLGGALVLGVALVLLLGRVRGIRRDVH